MLCYDGATGGESRCQTRHSCVFLVNKIIIILQLLPPASVVLIALRQTRRRCIFLVNRITIVLKLLRVRVLSGADPERSLPGGLQLMEKKNCLIG